MNLYLNYNTYNLFTLTYSIEISKPMLFFFNYNFNFNFT